MKELFVSDIKVELGRFTGFFLVQSAALRTTKAGDKNYFDIVLRDCTGDVPAKDWGDQCKITPESKPPVAGGFVKVEATPSLYKEKLQLTLQRWRPATEEEISLDDFIPASKRDRRQMWEEVCRAADSITDDGLLLFVQTLLGNNEAAFMDCPAAKKNHQPYLGGLMEHVLGILELVEKVCELYPKLNRDLLVAAAILHDLAKVEELSYGTSIEYTRVGRLVGHIALGFYMFGSHLHLLSPKLRDHFLHIVVSHHGRQEWGSPKTPMTREAYVFHLLDAMEARMNTSELLLASEPIDDLGFTPYSSAFESSLYFPERDNKV